MVKTLMTFLYTDWFIGNLIMVCYNPYMMGSKIPIYSNYPGPTPKKGYCFFTACNTAELVMRSTTATQQIVAGKELTYQPSKMFRDLSAKHVHLIYLHHDFPYVNFVPNVWWKTQKTQ